MKYTIELISDAQPGTGFGSEIVDDFVPRDKNGHPVLLASHVKGLIRNSLTQILLATGMNPHDVLKRVESVLGAPFKTGSEESQVRLTDAMVSEEVKTLFVNRTALDEYGTALDASLRTDEVIPAGTVFKGEIFSDAPENSFVDAAWKLGLLSIFSIGGSRNRGCGQCVVDLPELSKEDKSLKALLQKWMKADISTPADASGTETLTLDENEPFVPVRLIFHAMSPVCVPETVPGSKTNEISTGFSIPASAVRGMLIRLFQNYGKTFQTNLYECPKFIAWPLQPCVPQDQNDKYGFSETPAAVRVSLTHRAAKFSVKDVRSFEDEAIQPIEKVPDKAPMKAADGVLLYGKGKDGKNTVQLWKASDMPHDLQLHFASDRSLTSDTDERELYSIDSIAAMTWQGLVMLPQSLAEKLIVRLSKKPEVAFGIRRSVQGLGKLEACILKPEDVSEWKMFNTGTGVEPKTVLILQSPVSIPNDLKWTEGEKKSADHLLKKMVERWLIDQKTSVTSDDISNTWGNPSVLFGWNGHEGGLQRAHRVMLPGSVIQFKKVLPAEDLYKLLQAGFIVDTKDVRRGYGAVSVHPGTAEASFQPESSRQELKEVPTQKAVVEDFLQIFNKHKRHLPSPAQISALRERYKKSPREAKIYFEVQMKRNRIWKDWAPIRDELAKLLWPENLNSERQLQCVKGLEMLTDLAITENKN